MSIYFKRAIKFTIFTVGSMLLIASCGQKVSEDIELVALSPVTYKLNERNYINRVDYFYVKGPFLYNSNYYQHLKKLIDERTATIDLKVFRYYSIYIYRETGMINDDFKGGKKMLDGHNKDLIAYLRYIRGKRDIFYMIDQGNVVFDLVAFKEDRFEFDQ